MSSMKLPIFAKFAMGLSPCHSGCNFQQGTCGRRHADLVDVRYTLAFIRNSKLTYPTTAE